MFQTKLIKFADNCCLAMCYLRASGVTTFTDMLKALTTSIEKKYIGEDGFVIAPTSMMKLKEGKIYAISKCAFRDVKDGEMFCANYYYAGYNHWVLCKKNGNEFDIIFNSLDKSNCVNNGAPDLDDVRRITEAY